MTARRLGPFGLIALAIGAIIVGRRLRAHIAGREVPCGILIGDPGACDTHSQRLFGSRSWGSPFQTMPTSLLIGAMVAAIPDAT